jgi:hypothetical protein
MPTTPPLFESDPNVLPPPFPTATAGTSPSGSTATATMPGTSPPDYNFGAPVPDATNVTAQDSPGPLFTEENMGADNTGDFLQGYADKAPEIKPEETMQGQLEKVLNTDNALFDWARGQAAQYSNSRGLQNSDIAAEASSQAVFQNAIPIAQFDAEVYAQRAAQEREFWYSAGRQAFDATIQSRLMAQDHLQQLVQMSHQGDINSRLQLEQYGYNWNLNEQQNLHTKEQLALQGDIQSRHLLEAFGYDMELMDKDFGYRFSLQQQDHVNLMARSDQDLENDLVRLDVQNAATMDQIAANSAGRINEINAQGNVASQQDADRFTMDLQGNYLGAVEREITSFGNRVNAIWNNGDMNAAQQQHAVEVEWNQHIKNLNFYADMYSNSPGWDPAWIIEPLGVPTNPNPGDTTTPDTTTPDTTTPDTGGYTPPDAGTPPLDNDPDDSRNDPDIIDGLPSWKRDL